MALIAFSQILKAQDTSRVKALNEVVISTSRTEKEASTVPRSVTVISDQQIVASNVKTLPELLSQMESIYIVGNGMNAGGNQSVSMRGTNTNQTAILIDGILLNDPSSPNNAFDIGDLTLTSIERIEIVRGSNSALYGSGAIGGSINIITKEKGDKPFEAGVDLRYGSDYAVNNAFIRYSDKSGIYGSIGLNTITSKGFDATMDTSTLRPIQPRDLDDFHQTDFIGKIGYDKKNFKISLTAKSLEKFSNIDNGAFSNDNNNTLATNRQVYQIKSQYILNPKVTFQGNLAYTANQRTNINDSSLVARDTADYFDHSYFKGINTGNNLQGEILSVFKLKSLNAVLGLGLNNENMNMETEYYYNDPSYPYQSKTNYADSNLLQKNTYAFFHGDYNFEKQGFKALNLAAGMRLNMHNVYGNTLAFEASPSYSKNGNTIYASFTSGFLNPSLYQLYANDQNTMLFGNKRLDPQHSKSKEIGFKTIVNKTTYFTASVFNITTRKPIQYVNLWDKNSMLDSLSYFDFKGNTYLNLGKQVNSGVDFSLSIKANEQLSLSLRYCYVSSKFTVSSTDIDTLASSGNHIQLFEGGTFLSKSYEEVKMVRRPTNTLNLVLNYKPSEHLSFRIDTRYITSRYDAFYNPNLGPYGALDSKLIDGYTLLDFHARYFITNSISIGLKIDNLLNTKYTEIIGYRTRGTTTFLDFQVKL